MKALATLPGSLIELLLNALTCEQLDFCDFGGWHFRMATDSNEITLQHHEFYTRISTLNGGSYMPYNLYEEAEANFGDRAAGDRQFVHPTDCALSVAIVLR